MVQGLFGGRTSYEMQSLQDINKDLDKWKKYSQKTFSFFEEQLTYLNNQNYIKNIPYDLKMIFFQTCSAAKTIINDIEIIEISINNNRITNREVELLKNIGVISIKLNQEYGLIYHEDTLWHEYDNSNFKIAEDLYGTGRDYFVTLQDASNAAERLKQYINNDVFITNNSTNFINNGVVNNLQQGNDNTIMIENQHSISDIQEINELLKQLIDNLDRYFDKNQNEKQIEAKKTIESIQKELLKSKPQVNFLKQTLESLALLNGSYDFILNVTSIIKKINNFF